MRISAVFDSSFFGPGVRYRAGPQDRRHRRALRRSGRHPDDRSATSGRRRAAGRAADPGRPEHGCWVRSTPARSPSCTSCCSSSSLAARSGTCPRHRPRRCWPRSDPATSPARPGAASPRSWWRTWSGSTHGRRAAKKELTDLACRDGHHAAGPARHRTDRRARLLVEVGDITRFPTKAHFASWNGTAPIDASSGDQVRHRLSRAGNRQINRRPAHHGRCSTAQPDTEGRGYYERKIADGKTPDGSHARRETPTVRHRLPADAQRRRHAQPGRAREDNGDTTLNPARPAHIPTPALRTSHFPDPPQPQPTTPLPAAS